MKKKYEEKALEIAQLVGTKNKAYGDSLSKIGQILELLYGNSISKERYNDLHIVVRILDKLSRIASGDKEAFEEDPFEDICGYSLNKIVHDT